MPHRLSIIIVSWNVRELLERALHSAYASWGARPGLEIIVVDNASTDGTLTRLADKFPQTRVIANQDNRGFTQGNNQGLAATDGEFILLLNPDTTALGDALPRLVAYLAAHPHAGMVGPQLLNADRSIQSSRRRFPTLPVLFGESTWLESCLPRRVLQKYYVQDQPPGDIQAVDWITGAAMLTRREIYEELGGLDEEFFMYSEELDWCRRIQQAGWEIHYYPDAQIVHYEGKSSEQVVAARHIHFQTSKVHYARKYHGPLIAGALRRWLLAQYRWQLAVESLKWLLGNQRELRAARVTAYRQVLHSKLRREKIWTQINADER